MPDVVIIGGGLAGLVCSIRLARAGISTTLVEKKSYPFHRVCGEYVSNEVYPFLEREELLDDLEQLPQINQFQLTSENGNSARIELGLGGFGISRYKFDRDLYLKAIESGVNVIHDVVRNVKFDKTENRFRSELGKQDELKSNFVVGAHGKRSSIDKNLNRQFIQNRSPWVGVKYHLKYEVPDDEIALHNFPGGYCGISKVENNITNLCYLTKRENVQAWKDIREMEKNVLFKNPYLEQILTRAEILFEKPMVINEVSFAPKTTVENGILMIGDSAGLIAPLCGNGMAMAIHSGKLISDILIQQKADLTNRARIESAYENIWKKAFKRRLWTGRKLQSMFGRLKSSNLLVNLMNYQPRIARYLINKTHGKPI